MNPNFYALFNDILSTTGAASRVACSRGVLLAAMAARISRFHGHGRENHSAIIHEKSCNAGGAIRMIVKEKISCPQDRDMWPSIKEIFVPILL